MRFRTGLPKDVSETIIIMTGRYWMAQYEWNAHKAAALQNGVNPAIVDAIATGKRPTGMPPEMEVAYNLIDELLTTHQVTDATFKAAKDKYGERGVVDMIGLSGWYGLVSMSLNVDRYPLAQGVQPELKPLENPLPVVGMGFATPVPGTPSPAEVKSTVKGKGFTLTGRPLQAAHLRADDSRAEEDDGYHGRWRNEAQAGASISSCAIPMRGQLFFDMGDRVRFHMSVPDKLKEIGDHAYGALLGCALRMAGSPAGRRAGRAERGKVKAIAEGRRPAGHVCG